MGNILTGVAIGIVGVVLAFCLCCCILPLLTI